MAMPEATALLAASVAAELSESGAAAEEGLSPRAVAVTGAPVAALLFLAAGFFGTMGYFFITWAYRLLDISALQSITFLGIVWAALMDVAVWGKTSDIWTFVGAAIIVASTTYIAHREARAGAAAGGKKT